MAGRWSKSDCGGEELREGLSPLRGTPSASASVTTLLMPSSEQNACAIGYNDTGHIYTIITQDSLDTNVNPTPDNQNPVIGTAEPKVEVYSTDELITQEFPAIEKALARDNFRLQFEGCGPLLAQPQSMDDLIHCPSGFHTLETQEDSYKPHSNDQRSFSYQCGVNHSISYGPSNYQDGRQSSVGPDLFIAYTAPLPDNHGQLQLTKWVYETSNQKITLAERFEKMNW